MGSKNNNPPAKQTVITSPEEYFKHTLSNPPFPTHGALPVSRERDIIKLISLMDLTRQLSSNANQNRNVFNHWSTKIEQNPELLATNLFCILSIWQLKLTNYWVGWQIQTPLASDKCGKNYWKLWDFTAKSSFGNHGNILANQLQKMHWWQTQFSIKNMFANACKSLLRADNLPLKAPVKAA